MKKIILVIGLTLIIGMIVGCEATNFTPPEPTKKELGLITDIIECRPTNAIYSLCVVELDEKQKVSMSQRYSEIMTGVMACEYCNMDGCSISIC